MALKIDKAKKIIIDADVIIHFSKGDQLGLLNSIFPNKIYIFDVVFSEVFIGDLRNQVENLIRFKVLQELEFDGDIRVAKEFARLKRQYGIGESACMAYCRYNDDVIASSNLRDIKPYCTQHKIQFLTTMDFIYEAFCNTQLTEPECDLFINMVLSKGSRLPFRDMRSYLRSI